MGGTPNILVVDDSSDFLEATARALRRDGYDVRLATQGEEALRLLEEEPATVVLADHDMPGMKGTELLATLKDLYPRTVRIMLTGSSGMITTEEVVNRCDVHRFLSKPFGKAELLFTVRHAIERQELEQAYRDLQAQISRQKEELLWLNEKMERRLEDQSLRIDEKETLWRSLFGSVSDGIVLTRLDETIKEMNPAAVTMVGISESACLGRSFSEVFEPAGDEPELRRMLRSFPSVTGPGDELRRPRQLTTVFRRRDSTTYRVELAVSDVTDDGDRCRCVILRVLDLQQES